MVSSKKNPIVGPRYLDREQLDPRYFVVADMIKREVLPEEWMNLPASRVCP